MSGKAETDAAGRWRTNVSPLEQVAKHQPVQLRRLVKRLKAENLKGGKVVDEEKRASGREIDGGPEG